MSLIRLSEMQKWMMKRAAVYGRCYYADVLELFFKFPTIKEARNPDYSRRLNQDDEDGKKGQLRSPGNHHFSMEEIGEKRYRAAQASISRSTARLQERGYVTCITGQFRRWSAIELTESGREIVAMVPVNTVVKLSQC